MNGLLVNSYHSSYDHQTRRENDEQKKHVKRTHYHTWPRKRRSSTKRKISQIINQIKSERAISQIDLKINPPNRIHEFWNYEVTAGCEEHNYIKILNNQKRNQYLNQYDEKLRKRNNEPALEGCDTNQISKSPNSTAYSGLENGNTGFVDHNIKSTVSNEFASNEYKLGIVRLLRNWKLGKDRCDRRYPNDNQTAFSDTRSSVSSINTLNESDSMSFSSDVTFPVFKLPKSMEHRDKIISSSHLIQLQRPENVPPKPVSEQLKHQKEYERMVEAAKKKEHDKDVMLRKQRENRLKEEERLSQATSVWLNEILPNWNQMKDTKKAKNLWWNGLPPCVRGKVWSLSVGNKLDITKERYLECVRKSKEILKTGSKDSLQMNESYEHSVELIRLDISRTFPHLCIFQQGGPYYDVLHSLLGAYVCYQPEIGYVQGMSFIAAVLLLNMEEVDAFICFANMMNQPCHKAFYSLDVQKMKTYYLAYTDLLRVNMYDLYKHVNETSLSPDLYLVDWVYTLFSKSMNLDLACRLWDLIVRDGESFIFRASLGIMHLSKNELLKLDFLRSAQYLTKLPEDLCPDKLFKSISCIRMNNGSFTFEDLLQQYDELMS